ncbi:hypothetical protein [uncultured Aliiroseovarius sp.]|uniref:hypothetical protein n=1 Tax=uncultured Aliiroseovarius sp. TaxID=1658783 RepID=UPI002592AB7C|nr:hypothetical protein [uncultured Aliiroseovarius sp.]
MEKQTPHSEQWDSFYHSEQRHRTTFNPMIDEFRNVASQYGMMIFRQLALLNGGALVAIAPIANMLENPEIAVFGRAAGWFVAGLVAVMIASYAAHLNFTLLSDSLEDTRNKRISRSFRIFVEGDEPDANEIEESKHKRSIWISFWASHLFGWLSVLVFCLGAYTLIGATQ